MLCRWRGLSVEVEGRVRVGCRGGPDLIGGLGCLGSRLLQVIAGVHLFDWGLAWLTGILG